MVTELPILGDTAGPCIELKTNKQTNKKQGF